MPLLHRMRAAVPSREDVTPWLVVFVTVVAVVGMTLGPVAATPSVTTIDPSPRGHDSVETHPSVDDEVDPDVDAVVNGTVGLGDARTSINGTANASVGRTVVGVGNLSGTSEHPGNATNDIALGAPEAGEDERGAVYLFFGPVDEGEFNVSEANMTLTGESAGDSAGYDVAAGDLTGDGMQDLVVSAPGAGSANGTVYVFYGADLREHVADGDRNVSLADASVAITGDEAGDHFGYSVAVYSNATTDASGDEQAQAYLAVGAPRANERAGAAYVFEFANDSGDDELGLASASEECECDTVVANASDATASFTGEAESDRAGWSVALVANYTGDGDPALAVGAPFHDAPEKDAGAVYIVTNATEGGTLADANLTLEGVSTRDLAGWSVADASDLDGDGRHDLVVGAPFSNASAYNAGSVYVHFAASHEENETDLDEVDRVIHGEYADDLLGWSVTGSSNLTCGEKYGAVLLGAPANWQSLMAGGNATGSAYLVHGAELSGDNGEANFSLENATATFRGASPGDHAGSAVAAPGDVTGDDDGDVLIGATGVNDSRGAAYVVEGDCPVVEEAFFDVEIEDTNDPVEAGDQVVVSVEVTNTGDKPDEQDIGLKIDGERVDVAHDVELDPGESETVRLVWETNSDDAGDHTAVAYSDDDRDKHRITVTEPEVEEAFFDVEIADTNSPVEAGEDLEVRVSVTNRGDATGEQDVGLKIGGERVDVAHDVELDPGEAEHLTLVWETDSDDAGDYTAVAYSDDDSEKQRVTVTDVEEAFFDVRDVDTNAPVEVGETLTVEATVKNTGGVEDTQNVRFRILDDDGETVFGDSEELTLDSHESETLAFEWDTEDAEPGSYTAVLRTEDDTSRQEFEVLEEETEPDRGSFATDYRGCGQVWIVFDEEPEDPVTVTVEVYDQSSDQTDSVEVTITADELDRVPGQYGQDPLFKLKVGEHAGGGDGKIVGVTSEDFSVGGEGEQNPNQCARRAPQTGSVSGTVTDEDDQPIEGATVTVEGTDLAATTDDDGEYTIDDVPAGTYEVTADADGYEAETEADVEVEADDTTTLDFELETEMSPRIDSCTVITEPGEYELVADLQPEEGEVCLKILVGNVTIDGNGHTIDGSALSDSTDSTGILIDTSGDSEQADGSGDEGVEIRDVRIVDWTDGVSLLQSAFVGIEETDIRDTDHAIDAEDGNDFDLRNVLIEDNGEVADGFWAFGEVQISESVIRDNGNGLVVYDGALAIESSVIENNGGAGVVFSDMGEVTIADTVVRGNAGEGIVYRFADPEIRNVTLAANDGLELDQGPESDLTASSLTIGDSPTLEVTGVSEPMSLDDVDRDGLPELPDTATAAGAGLDVTIEEGTIEARFAFDAEDPDRVELWRDDGTEWERVEGATVDDGSIQATLSEGGIYAPVVVAEQEASVEGTVTDAETGEPIENATVEVDGATVTTGDDGSYSVDVDAGTYDVTAEADGYEAGAEEAVEIASGENASVDFALTPLEPATFDVVEVETDAPVTEPGPLTVEAAIENTGDLAGSQNVTLQIDGEAVDVVDVELDAGERTAVALEWSNATAGEYAATVLTENDSEERSVTIDAAEPVLQDVELELDETELEAGSSTGYTVTAVFADGTEEDVTAEATVSSGNESVLEVDDTELTAVSAGNTEITAAYDGLSDSVGVNVTEPASPDFEAADDSAVNVDETDGDDDEGEEEDGENTEDEAESEEESEADEVAETVATAPVIGE